MKHLKPYKIFESWADKRQAIIDYLKKDILDMDMLYDIKDAALEYLDKDPNYELKIEAYIKYEYEGNVKKEKFFVVNFNHGRDFESAFNLEYHFISLFGTDINDIKDALSGKFEKYNIYKFIELGYDVAIIDTTKEENWFDIEDEINCILNDETDSIIRRIKTMYPDQIIQKKQ
jgi:hypothetical protein